ncbi:neutral zinc metallopeptidase [Cellulomonas fimi]|uniref:Neutral zinc metallopeptidase n=1 Tax=Cellulomonas fimi TaxID=1708 RepID=A0A7Y0LYW7_CELFI|nr:neutral zinc metallopeptidase [Cellulomonas fimi]NMR20772.1 neutral zinc metallopeptidase [Cellulomonas fimi]
MTFSEGGSFEGGRVRTSRGRGAAIGGGIGGIVVLLGALLFGQDLGPLVNGLGGGGGAAQEGAVGDCTAEQANSDPLCRLAGASESLDVYWAGALPAVGVEYVQPGVVSFEQSVSTACGNATSATGPFYCPPDQTVYLDLGFWDDLRDRFGAQGGPLAEMYVIAHEFGHHVQTITGVMEAADRTQTGPDSDGVRIELMADCLAGMWAGDASTTVDPETGITYLEPITAEELGQAISAAEAVGDDRIQEQATGTVNPEAWTHGSAEQRRAWFTVGYDGASFQDCNLLEGGAI